jgi:predicted secreted hydrolase
MTGRVIGRGDHAFSYAATLFRYEETSAVTVYSASISILDESSGRFVSERRTENAALGLAEASGPPLSFRIGTWRLTELVNAGHKATFDLDARLQGGALVLHGTAIKRSVTFHSGGVEHEDYTSIATSGNISVADDRADARGKSWLSHQCSRVMSPSTESRAQIRVQLDDGREIYIETSPWGQPHEPVVNAWFIERDGALEVLKPHAFGFGANPGSTWLSPNTRTKYPDIWGLTVADKTPNLSLEPVIYRQESLADGQGASYWDGAVDIYDVTPGSQGLRLGSGYVLMLPRSRQR